jgi:hypothetical protein
LEDIEASEKYIYFIFPKKFEFFVSYQMFSYCICNLKTLGLDPDPDSVNTDPDKYVLYIFSFTIHRRVRVRLPVLGRYQRGGEGLHQEADVRQRGAEAHLQVRHSIHLLDGITEKLTY